jgi:hypothetical protein
MSGEALRVTRAHLRGLAARQARAAAEITLATAVVEAAMGGRIDREMRPR